jgi:nucleoid DNA-binding protein
MFVIVKTFTKKFTHRHINTKLFFHFTFKELFWGFVRNPATGEAMMMEARQVVTFRCSGQLRDKING